MHVFILEVQRATSILVDPDLLLQNGPRGRREREFYEKLRAELRSEKTARLRLAAQAAAADEASDDDQASVSGRSDDESQAQANFPFSTRNAAMLTAVPRFRKFTMLCIGKSYQSSQMHSFLELRNCVRRLLQHL